MDAYVCLVALFDLFREVYGSVRNGFPHFPKHCPRELMEVIAENIRRSPTIARWCAIKERMGWIPVVFTDEKRWAEEPRCLRVFEGVHGKWVTAGAGFLLTGVLFCSEEELFNELHDLLKYAWWRPRKR